MFPRWFRKPVFMKRASVIDQLEDRIVLDAAVPSTPDNSANDHNPAHQAFDAYPGADASTGTAPTGLENSASQDTDQHSGADVTVVIDGDPHDGSETGARDYTGDTRVLVVSSTISGADLLVSAAKEGVITVVYDGSTDELSTILSDIRSALGDQEADSIAFATHEIGNARFYLTSDCSVDSVAVATDTELQGFWQGIGSLLTDNGRVDLMMCDLVSTDAGCALVSQLESLVGHDIAASDDPTGNPGSGGDWILEYGNVNVAEAYFVSGALSEHGGILADEQPVLSLDGSGDPLNYYEGDGPQVMESLITIADSDSENMESASIQITGNYQDGEDVLGIEAGYTLPTSVTATWEQSTGTLEVSGSATKTQFEAILEHVTYTNTRDAPDTGDRTVTWAVNDGTSASEPRTTTVAVTPVNDAPEGADNFITIREDLTYTLTAADFGFSDPDDSPANAFIGVTITQLPTAGSLQLGGVDVTPNQSISRIDIDAGKLIFMPGADATGTACDNFRFAVVDDGTAFAGTLDVHFGADGMVTTNLDSYYYGNSVAIQSDGKIVMAGRVYIDVALIRYNADGSLDPSFAGDGIVTTNLGARGYGNSVAIQSDGKIVVAGTSNENLYVVRYNADGSLDTSFGGGDGIVTMDLGGDEYGNSVAIQSDGKIVVVGTADGNFCVLRYTADGILDPRFGGGDGIVTLNWGNHDLGFSVAIQSDGNIVVAGSVETGSSEDFALVRLNGTELFGEDTDQAPNTITFDVTSLNDAPQGTDKTITMLEDGTYTLTAADFGFSDPADSPGNAFESVTITELPAAGSLMLDGFAVTLGQVITSADIDAGMLIFTPEADASGVGCAGFQFAVTDDGGTANGGEDTDPTPNTITF